MSQPQLHLLLIEDSADDAELITRSLTRGGYPHELSCADSEPSLRRALTEDDYDIVITDHELPGFNSADVLEILDELAPDLPCLLVSGKVGEEAVGQAMRQGAVDYVSKDNLWRLPAALARALAENELRRERNATAEALASSGRLFEAVFTDARDTMLIVDHERRLIDANPAAAELLIRPRSELVKLRIEELVPETSRVAALATWDGILSAGHARGELQLLRADGELVATEYTAAANFLPGQHILVMRDIRERQAAEAEVKRRIGQQEAIAALGELALREKSLDLLREAAVTCAAATLDVEIASILELRAGEGAFVIQAETGLGKMRAGVRIPHGPSSSSHASYTVLQGDPVLVEDYAEEKRFARAPILSDWGVRSALSVHIRGNEQPFGVLETASTRPQAFSADDASFLTAIANILSDALQRAGSEEETQKRALHDDLTGLANRTLFFDRLEQGLARSKRLGTRLAVVFLDIDHFKSLNDTLGHLAADRLLTQVGQRIEGAMRDSDTVARFGGDEFVVLCEDLGDEQEAEILAARIDSAFESPFSVDNEPHTLSASIGIALSDADNLDREALLRDADTALYHSKEGGRAKWTLATEEMRVAVVERGETKRAIERAIAGDELRLHYQPIVALDGGKLCAVEALVRWEDPQRGLVLPGQFIPLAEETGLIVRLGEWVLRAACRQAALWRATLGDEAPLPIHVNFSARQVAQASLPELMGKVLADSGVPPSDIAVEITETALIDSLGGSIVTLRELKSMGLTVVLDDFGTGYSSLSYLERFPIDTLKIDRTFVSPLVSPNEPAPIVTAILGMARALGVETIAEGVETADQGAAVAALGGKHAQGYFFARPAPADEITKLVHDNTPLRQRAAEASALAPLTRSFTWAGHLGAGKQSQATSVADYRQSFLSALLAVDSQAASEIVKSALADQIRPEVIDAHVIGASLVEIGGLWERGEVSVAQEHLATGIASQAAGLAAGPYGRPDSRLSTHFGPQTVLLANVAGEDHILGLRMVADMLQSLGLDVRYLGSKIPHAELCAAAADLQPDVVGLSLTLPELGPRLEEHVVALREACPQALFLVGGQGVTPELVERTAATYVSNVEKLVEMATRGPLQGTAPPRLARLKAQRR